MRTRKAQKLVVEKVLDALHRPQETLEVECCVEKQTSLLERAGSCRDARDCPFLY